METITQETVDEIFKEAKAEWDAKVAESGHCEAVFIVQDEDQWASGFLVGYAMAKENVESMGLTIPDLVEGMNITLTEEGDDNETRH